MSANKLQVASKGDIALDDASAHFDCAEIAFLGVLGVTKWCAAMRNREINWLEPPDITLQQTVLQLTVGETGR
jgi:hypothetical protein